MTATEKQLDEAFAKELAASPGMVRWLVSQTRFGFMADEAVLLQEELRAARGLSIWWRHWWYRVPGWGDSETDIFTVFSAPRANCRFALHIENKKANGRFTPRQAEMYRARASYMMALPRVPPHDEFATVLLAPSSFLRDHRDEVLKFDICLSHEEIGAWVPAFAS